MPLSEKGVEVKKSMEKEYGPKKGEEVFYASENKGNIKGLVDDSIEIFSHMPQVITQAELNAQNRKLWEQKTANEAPKNP